MQTKNQHGYQLNVDNVLDMIESERELILTIPEICIDTVKSRLSQGKHNRGIKDRMRMEVIGSPWEFITESNIAVDAVDLHVKLGNGVEIPVLAHRKVDTDL